MSTTVAIPGGLEVTSNHESGDAMLSVLSPKKAEAGKPHVIVDKGKSVTETPDEQDETSRAASTLGKKGGQAAAKAREAVAKAKPATEGKDAKAAPADDEKATPEKVAKGKAEDADPDETEAADATGKPRDDPKARIRQLAEQKRQEKERADRAERQLAEERRARTAPAAPAEERRPEAPAQAAAKAPELADFKNYEDFVDARSEWKAREVIRQEREQHAARERHVEEDRQIRGVLESFGSKLDSRATEDESFRERTGKPQDLFDGLSVPQVLQPSFTLPRDDKGRPKGLTGYHVAADYVIQSDYAPDLFEHFAENPQELQRIATLRTPPEVREAMAELVGTLKAGRSDAATADTSSGREVSKAGTPPRSVGGSPHTAEPDIHGDIPFDTFVARNKARKR